MSTDNHPNPDPYRKYQGKSREEIIEMHKHAERLIGKLSNELGRLRRNVPPQDGEN